MHYDEHINVISPRVYALAVGSVIAFVGLRFLLNPILHNQFPLAFLIFAVAFSAWLGGRGPGYIATGTAIIFGNFFFLEPFHSFSIHKNEDLFRIIWFALEGGALTWFIWKYREKIKRQTNSSVRYILKYILNYPIVAITVSGISCIPLFALGIYIAEQSSPSSLLKTYEDCFWWTLGIAFRIRLIPVDPATSLGRIFAAIQIVIGWLVTIVVFSKIFVTMLKRRTDACEKGTIVHSDPGPFLMRVSDYFRKFSSDETQQSRRFAKHTVIFGWNKIVREYIEFNINVKFSAETPVVVVCTKLTHEMVAFAKRMRSKGLLIIENEGLSNQAMRKLGIESASEILIIQPKDSNVKSDEVVVRIATMVSALAEDAKIVVEIEDLKYVKYLKKIGVTEIRKTSSHLKVVKKNIQLDNDPTSF